jgi:hypothetical protein
VDNTEVPVPLDASAGPDEATAPTSKTSAALHWIGASLTAVVVVAAGWLLWSARLPWFQYMVMWFAVIALVAAAILVWIAWVVIAVVAGPERRGSIDPLKYYYFGLLASSVVAAMLIAVQVPLKLNVWASQSALLEQVRSTQAGPAPAGPRTVGGFRAERVELVDPGCRGDRCEVVFHFDLASSGPSALLYSPAGQPQFKLSGAQGHLFGHWYWAADD